MSMTKTLNRGRKSKLAIGSLGSILVKLFSVVLGFILAVILARSLGPEHYGIYGFTLALVSLVAIPAQVGLPNLVVRETARARAMKDWSLMRGVWHWATRYVLLSSLLLLGLVMLGLLHFSPRLAGARFDSLIIALPLIPLVALGNIRGAALRGLRHVVLGQLPEKVIRTAAMIILCVAFILSGQVLGESFNATNALGLYVIAASIAFVVGALMLWQAKPTEVRHEATMRVLAPEWRRAVVPLAMISGLHFLNSHADILLLGLLRSDEEVGIYRVALQLANLVVFGLAAINTVLHPFIVRLHLEGKTKELQRLAIVSARITLAMALPPVLFFLLFGGWLLATVFGDEYVPASVALAILALGQMVNAAMGAVGTLLTMTGHERDTARGLMAAFVTNIILNLALIPRFGIEGAAVATAASTTLWNLILWRMVWLRLRIRSFGLSRL